MKHLATDVIGGLNRTLKRARDAVVDANLRYTRVVLGDRHLADRGAPPSSPRRGSAER